MRRALAWAAKRWREAVRTPTIARLSGDGTHPDPVVELLLHQAPDACLVIDAAGRVVRTNPALAALVGSAPDISPGADAALIFDPTSRPEIWAKVVQLLRGQPMALRAIPGSLPTAAGATQVLVSADPVRNGTGAIDGAVLRLTDISRQIELETQLAQSQKQQAVGQMAAGIAHDFNNLLTAIMGAADAIVTRPGIDPETLEEAGHIQNGAERGAALVRQLLAFSRPQALQPRGLAVNPVMTAMAGMLRRLLGETIKLELDLETPGRAIMIDPTQLDQVLLNLAVNARDAMPEGGVLTLRSGHLALYRARPNGGETIPPNRYVTIEVSDTGTGIPPELLPRIFDPFFTTKQDKNGTGLGLASVRDIVGHAGGYLTVESVLGQGTRLRLLFPRWDGALDALPATAAPAPIAATVPGRVVLLVEDEEPVRRLAARSFERRGWTVLSAASGEAALSLLATEDRPISAIVSDMVLQGMDGAALVRAVRDQPGHANVPAVLVSGYAEAVVRRETADVATAFIAKPYLPRDLVSRVETILDNNTAPPV